MLSRKPHFKAIARNWADANPSDPFAYRTALSHLLTGIATEGAYSVKWRNETRSYRGANGEENKQTIRVPYDMKEI